MYLNSEESKSVGITPVLTFYFHVHYSSFCCFSVISLFKYLSTNKLTRKNKLFKNNFIYTFVSLTVWPLSSFTRSPNSNNSLKEQISSFKQYSKVVNWKSLHSKNYRVWNFKNKEKKLGYACRGSLSALFFKKSFFLNCLHLNPSSKMQIYKIPFLPP